MTKLVNLVHARLDLWGTRLNILAGLLVAYMAANGAVIERAVNSVVPEPYRPIASVVIGLVSYVLVNTAAKRDAKKIANG